MSRRSSQLLSVSRPSQVYRRIVTAAILRRVQTFLLTYLLTYLHRTPTFVYNTMASAQNVAQFFCESCELFYASTYMSCIQVIVTERSH